MKILNNKYSIIKLIIDTLSIGIEFYQLRIDKVSTNEILTILETFNNSCCRGIELILKYDERYASFLEKDNLCLIISNYKRLTKIIIHSSPFETTVASNIHFSKCIINDYTKEKLGAGYYFLSLKTFHTAIQGNVGLKGLISINRDGLLMNYLDHKKNFGYWNNINWRTVIYEDDFKMMAGISNDEVEKCKECAFRYMCISTSELVRIQNKWYKSNYCDHV